MTNFWKTSLNFLLVNLRDTYFFADRDQLPSHTEVKFTINIFYSFGCFIIIADLNEPCQISQTHMMHRCNLVAIVGTGPGAKFFNDKGELM